MCSLNLLVGCYIIGKVVGAIGDNKINKIKTKYIIGQEERARWLIIIHIYRYKYLYIYITRWCKGICNRFMTNASQKV